MEIKDEWQTQRGFAYFVYHIALVQSQRQSSGDWCEKGVFHREIGKELPLLGLEISVAEAFHAFHQILPLSRQTFWADLLFLSPAFARIRKCKTRGITSLIGKRKVPDLSRPRPSSRLEMNITSAFCQEILFLRVSPKDRG